MADRKFNSAATRNQVIRQRNAALGLVLVFFVVLFFAITVVKMKHVKMPHKLASTSAATTMTTPAAGGTNGQ